MPRKVSPDSFTMVQVLPEDPSKCGLANSSLFHRTERNPEACARNGRHTQHSEGGGSIRWEVHWVEGAVGHIGADVVWSGRALGGRCIDFVIPSSWETLEGEFGA